MVLSCTKTRIAEPLNLKHGRTRTRRQLRCIISGMATRWRTLDCRDCPGNTSGYSSCPLGRARWRRLIKSVPRAIKNKPFQCSDSSLLSPSAEPHDPGRTRGFPGALWTAPTRKVAVIMIVGHRRPCGQTDKLALLPSVKRQVFCVGDSFKMDKPKASNNCS